MDTLNEIDFILTNNMPIVQSVMDWIDSNYSWPSNAVFGGNNQPPNKKQFSSNNVQPIYIQATILYQIIFIGKWMAFRIAIPTEPFKNFHKKYLSYYVINNDLWFG